MPAKQSVLVPFAYMAKGIARRDRTSKIHAVFEMLPILVPVLDAEHSISMTFGRRNWDLPVVDGRIARPTQIEDGSDPKAPTTFMDGSNSEEAVRARLRNTPSLEPVRWADAPIPVENLRYEGSICMSSDIKGIESSDREHRLPSAMQAAEHLALIGGKLCTFGDEPLFPVHVDLALGKRTFRIDSPVFHRSAVHAAGTNSRQGRNYSASPMHLRPDEVMALVHAGQDVMLTSRSLPVERLGGVAVGTRDSLGMKIDGYVKRVDWKADSASLSFADTMAFVYCAFSDTDERWRRLDFEMKETILEGVHAAMRIVNGRSAGIDVPDYAGRFLDRIGNLREEWRSPATATADNLLSRLVALSESCGWTKDTALEDAAETEALSSFTM
jgi:hypothetical protein